MSSFPASTPPNPPQRQPASPYEALTSQVSLAALIVCPILILLPPRKLDLYTFSLFGGMIVAANHQTELRTGNGIMRNLYWRKKEREDRLDRHGKWKDWEEDYSGTKGLAKKIWMGDEKPGWKEKRMREEREYAEQGKGVSDVILDQIKEVWRVDKKGTEEKNGEKKS